MRDFIMTTEQIPTTEMPESGQLWKYADDLDFLNSEQPFTVLDVTDNIVYFTQDEMHFKDGAFHNQLTIHNAYGTTCFAYEPFTYKRGIPSKILYKPLNNRKLRLDIFLNEFQPVIEIPTVHKEGYFLSSIKAIAKKLKSKISSI